MLISSIDFVNISVMHAFVCAVAFYYSLLLFVTCVTVTGVRYSGMLAVMNNEHARARLRFFDLSYYNQNGIVRIRLKKYLQT